MIIATPFGPMTEHEFAATRHSRKVVAELLDAGEISKTFAVVLFERITRIAFAKLMFESWETIVPSPSILQRVKLTFMMLGHFILWDDHEPELRNWLIVHGLEEERKQLARKSGGSDER